MATYAWMAKMRKPQKFSTRHRNRCQICGRPRGY
ncbi:MAG: type Z 30S ribosomal protein S14, partial [Elusimicrobiales bacterium]|nr:type Z 30S ribosomal protein S14 [Elusimicrobiales bacterium]